MTFKRVWAVRSQYHGHRGEKFEYKTLAEALADVEFVYEAGFSTAMTSYVVPA